MSRLAHAFGAALLAALTAGCGDDAETTAAPAPGTAVLSFSANGTVKSSTNLVDELKGPVYGALYLTEDVNLAGPISGAEQWEGIDVPEIDLTTADVSSVTYTTTELPPGSYNFLGFFDVDGNGADTKDPEEGDPVTLATSNTFTIESGKETAYTVTFDLIF